MAQAGGNVVNVANLFAELHHLGESGDYERALKVANKSMYAIIFFRDFIPEMCYFCCLSNQCGAFHTGVQ
jgi:hypothetical protein